MKLINIFALALVLLTANLGFAKTHCFVVIGEGHNYDPLYPLASELIRSVPLKGSCLDFKTWAELSDYFFRNQAVFKAEDQFFIAQAVHGSPGGRAWDREGSISPDRINDGTPLDQAGGTPPGEIVKILRSIASHHRVAFHDMSCHGGSLLTRYVQQMDAGASADESQSRLCVVTDSIQGMITEVRDLSRWPTVDLSGLSMTDVFRMNVALDDGVALPVITGLISAAKMSVMPGYSGRPSAWEGEQWPMVIYHNRNHKIWTGAYQACTGTLDENHLPVPIWGADWFLEQLYRPLSYVDREAANDCSITPHKASVESLDLSKDTLTQGQQLRRRACDEFRF